MGSEADARGSGGAGSGGGESGSRMGPETGI